MRVPLAAAFLSALSTPALAIEVDGRIDPDEWEGAQHVTDFRLTQPLSREPGPYPTDAWILATPDGLAIGFRNTQPASVPRNRQRGERDNAGAVDRVNLYVDFDGDGRTGYNFTVSLANSINDVTFTNENQFNDDWDADWQHAVTEDEGSWSAEMLIPWYIAPMRNGVNGRRTLSVGLDRVLSSTGERMSWPAVGYTEPRFLTVLQKVEVPEFSQALLAITPYVSGIYDNGRVTEHGVGSDFDAGADIFWKPNGKFQLSATLNPDFGQVESDELVVNFSATETFFSDKRPFFTENQGFFDVPFGSLNQRSRLLYTRRVDGDVTAAAKVNGSAAGFNYGAFAATEEGSAGRDFYALRGTRDFGIHGLGAMFTRVDKPALDRTANVYELDHRWVPNPQWNIRSTVIGSDVDQAGADMRDSGAQIIVDYDMGNTWRQQLYALHIGKNLQLNDFGYLERNNFNYLRYDVGHRVSGLPETSPYAGHDWHYAASRRSNDEGEFIAWAASINRTSDRRDGGNEFAEIAAYSSGQDDLITRGHGVVKMPEKLFVNYERFRPRRGNWAFEGEAHYEAEGLGGAGKGMIQLFFQPTYYINDDLSLFAGLQLEHNPDWLLWREDNLLGTYRSNLAYLTAGSTWLIDDKQELRVRLEAIGLDADALQAWCVAGDGTPVARDEEIPDIALRNLGFQIRYRYELAPLSYLYIAYVRGGSLYQEIVDEAGGVRRDPFDVGDEFRDAFDLRDSEQFLVKLSYRFEI